MEWKGNSTLLIDLAPCANAFLLFTAHITLVHCNNYNCQLGSNLLGPRAHRDQRLVGADFHNSERVPLAVPKYYTCQEGQGCGIRVSRRRQRRWWAPQRRGWGGAGAVGRCPPRPQWIAPRAQGPRWGYGARKAPRLLSKAPPGPASACGAWVCLVKCAGSPGAHAPSTRIS